MVRPKYSPINATFGVRMEQFIESDKDYIKYHSKLNRKLQKLRKKLNLTTRDTKHYSSKEKFSKLTSEDYDTRNKLFGTLLLLYIERDLSVCELYKLRARNRGKFKKSERKLVTERLKKSVKNVYRLLNLSQNETDWVIRIQYLIFGKLVVVENLLYGKTAKRKENDNISQGLAICFAALQFLVSRDIINQDLFDFIRSKYEYTLMQYAGGLLSPIDLHNFITNTIFQIKENNVSPRDQYTDELIKILFDNGFTIDLQDVEMDKEEKEDIIKHITWRAFKCTINDNHLAQMVEEARNIPIENISDYSNKIAKWAECVSYQENYINSNSSNNNINNEEIEDEENEQILLAYLKYQTIFASFSREHNLFNQLWDEWLQIGSILTNKILKYKELDRIVKNIKKYLQDLMELPGVYSDEDLLSQLELTQIYFTLHINAVCLGHLYQLKHLNIEALALYTDAYQKITETYYQSGITSNDDILLPNNILNKEILEKFIVDLKTKLSSIIALAEFETEFRNVNKSKYDFSTIDKLALGGKITLNDVKLDNLFPLRPQLIPIGAKPSLFDIAFNYIQYDNNSKTVMNETQDSTTGVEPSTIPSEAESTSADKEQRAPAKKRGFLGLFGR